MSDTTVFYSLHILKAVGLPQMRFREVPKAYVKIEVANLSMRTDTAPRTRNPVWNEQFQFPFIDDLPTNLYLRVKHDAHMPRNPSLGVYKIEPQTLVEMANPHQEIELKLTDPGGKDDGLDRGVVVVKLTVQNAGNIGSAAFADADLALQSGGILQAAGLENSRSAALAAAVTDTDSNTPNLVTTLGVVVSKLHAFVGLVDEAAKIHPYINITWKITSSLYKAVEGQLERDAKIVQLMNIMKDTYMFVDAIRPIPEKIQILENTILDILKQTVECVIFVREYSGCGFGKRLLTEPFSSNGEKIDCFSQRFLDLKRSFDSGVNVQTAFISIRVSDGVDRLVRNLELRPAQMDASLRLECQPDTRLDTLAFIFDWLMHPSGTQNILWLYGIAGSGKSTIATTVASHLREIRRLGAFLFFDRSAQSDPSVVIRTMAHKLGLFDSRIGDGISAAIRANPDIAESSLRLQFSKLLIEPLSRLKDLGNEGSIVVILDALDDRPQHDILTAFGRGNISSIELQISTDSNRKDILSYLRHRLADIRAANTRLSLSDNWPGEAAVHELCVRSAGLFIWCSTAMTFLQYSQYPDERMEILLQGEVRGKAESALDSLYEIALQESGLWVDRTFGDNFRAILGTIIFIKEPLLPEFIDELAGLNARHPSLHTIERFGCVLRWNDAEPVTLLHPSFADFLCDRERCKNDEWFIDRAVHNRLLTLACFRIMKKDLRFNICGLETSYLRNGDVPGLGDRIKCAIPTHLSYSCRFWANHLSVIASEYLTFEALQGHIKHFLSAQLLNWLEVLSLINCISIVPPSLLCLAAWLKDYDADMTAFAADARRFIIAFQALISESAPHIYLSALPFSPEASRVKMQYLTHFQCTLSIDLGNYNTWPTIINTIEGHSSFVNSIAFSPDSKCIVSGYWDHTIAVWDSETGKVEVAPFKGHSGSVNSVAFSLDGKYIVSGSDDTTICVWDAETGKASSAPFEGHSGGVTSVAFSPYGRCIASGSLDSTICIWDAKTGKVEMAPLKGHSSSVASVAFSPDGKHVVSGSTDCTIRVWGAETGIVELAPFEGHSSGITFVAFSPDGKHIASGSTDATIRLWDANTGKAASAPFQWCGDLFNSISFSPDGKHIVSGSSENNVHVWDVETGKQACAPFEGHHSFVNSVTYSPDGKCIASGSSDFTIRVWDAEMGKEVSAPFEGHSQMVKSVAISPDWKHIVSGSWDTTIRLWDAVTGKAASVPFDRHRGLVNSIAFSPDGKRIISGSTDTNICIWDAETGKSLSVPFAGHSQLISSISFSPNGKHIVSSSWDNTIRLWDAETGRAVSAPCEGHSDMVHSVVFSPDGKHIVSCSEDRTIRVWHVNTGNLVLAPFEGHSKPAYCVAFSLNGKHIASGSMDGTICIWDVETGKAISAPLEGHSQAVFSVAFSPDGVHIASGSADNTICVWDAETSKASSTSFEGHTQLVTSVAFSPNGKHIVSGSGDSTIRVWDTVTGNAVFAPFQGHSSSVIYVSFSPDGRHIASCSWDNTIRIWDAETGKAALDWISDYAYCIAFSPDGKYITSGSRDSTIQVWDVKTGKAQFTPFIGHSEWVTSVTFSPDGKHVVSGSRDRTIRVWDADTGEAEFAPFGGHISPIECIALSPDGKRVVSGSDGGTMCVWDVETGKALFGPFEAHSNVVFCVAFSPDGGQIVSGSADGTICIWNSDTTGNSASAPFGGHGSTDSELVDSNSIAFSTDSPDGLVLIHSWMNSNSISSLARWSPSNSHNSLHSSKGSMVVDGSVDPEPLIHVPFLGFSDFVLCVAFSPDGKRIVSGSANSTIRIWDAETGKALSLPFEGHRHSVNSVVFTPDGKCVISGAEDYTIHVWDAETGIGTSVPFGEGHSSNTTPTSATKTQADFGDSSKLMHGWMQNNDSDLLFWVPPYCRTALWWPRNTAVISQHLTKLNLGKFVHGTSWAQCYTGDCGLEEKKY